MKKILFTAAALLISTAAVAQMPPPGPGWNGGPPPPPPPGMGPGWHHGPGWNPNEFWRGAPENPRDRIQFLQDRVNRSVGDGSLDQREGWRVNRELNGLRGWIQRKHWEDQGPLTPDQRYQVQGKLDQISQQIRWLQHNGG